MEESLNFLSVAVQIQEMSPNIACWQPSRSDTSADPFGKFCTVILSFPAPTADLFRLRSSLIQRHSPFEAELQPNSARTWPTNAGAALSSSEV